MHIVRKVKDISAQKITCGIMHELNNKKDFEKLNIAYVNITGTAKKHFHKKLTEVYFVLKGAIDVEIDGKVEHLKENEMIMIFPETEHEAWKTSKEDAEILVICCPPWSEGDEVLVE